MRALAMAAIVGAAGCGGGRIGDPPVEISPDSAVEPPDAPTQIIFPDALPCTGADAQVRDPNTGTCYLYVAAVTTWALAAVDCEARGGTLTTATSAGENGILTGLPTTPMTLPDVWLGATDAVTEGTFTWVTAEVLAYTNWRTGEPNNGGTSGMQEDCAVLEADTLGTWDDRPCERTYPYLCELP